MHLRLAGEDQGWDAAVDRIFLDRVRRIDARFGGRSYSKLERHRTPIQYKQ
jgi:hypothetical protein